MALCDSASGYSRRLPLRKGLFWGFAIWAMYWLFQEWFIYHTLLREPVMLCALELSILLLGSLVEGVIISLILRPHEPAKRAEELL